MLAVLLSRHALELLQIKSRQSDEHVAARIINRLANAKGISYAEIARVALNRKDVALKLLDKEPKPSAQVQLLLCMDEDDLAIKKAIESGDSDLGEFAACCCCLFVCLRSFCRAMIALSPAGLL